MTVLRAPDVTSGIDRGCARQGKQEVKNFVTSRSQSDKFKETAKELEADEDEARWEERPKKVAKHKQEKPE
jgi:hypothetical protein